MTSAPLQVPAIDRLPRPVTATLLVVAGAAICAIFANTINSWLHVALLAAATLVSEDLTCVTAGELIRRGQFSAASGVFGCFAGIYLGDFALWMVGRTIGPRVLGWRWVERRVSDHRVKTLGRWFDRHAPQAILAARFLPGARLPMYLAAGMLRHSGPRFAIWTLVAALIWTPLVVLLVASAGDAFVAPFDRYLGGGWVAMLSAIVAAFTLVRVGGAVVTPIGRAKLIACVSKLWRWEFWPAWLFYAPLVPYIGYLSLRHVRRGGFRTITAANPGIPHGGGFVGESKFDILAAIRGTNVSPTAFVAPSRDFAHRVAVVRSLVGTHCWSFPLILKPDVGQRGTGVKLVRSIEEAAAYLAHHAQAVIAQPFHPGPFEAGVFYYRLPAEPRGRIFSITDKRVSQLVGDGVSTIEQLIWRHPRFRMQARTFLTRHAGARDRVLAAGETFTLAVTGNHCQGTMFCDGAHLITAKLEDAIDKIAKRFDGFYFGRFDVRYSDVARFIAGEDFTVIELNGVTSESTNLYDPTWRLTRAYRELFTQWRILFQVGAANVARGTAPTTWCSLVRDVRSHLKDPLTDRIAD